jgi:hypothetical protein
MPVFNDLSYEIWYAIIGAGVEPLGEIKSKEQVYQKELIHQLSKIANLQFVSKKL